MSIEFKDFSKIVISDIDKIADTFLEEVGGEIEAQAKQNTKVKTGKTKGSWEHTYDSDKKEVQIGSRYQNALWEELGTGIYALNGNGRETKWVYTPDGGKHFYATVGKKPRRMLWNAYTTLKNTIITEARRRFKNL